MGNSQTSATKTAGGEGVVSGGGMTSSSSTTTFGGSIRSRRGSKVKVFGLLGQKKQQKEPTTPTTPTATADMAHVAGTNSAYTSNVTPTTRKSIGHVESIDEEAELHQKHDAVVRQLEFEQMEIRRKEKTRKKDNSQLFIKCKRDISNKSYQTEQVPIHKKRLAPQPPPTTAAAKTATQTIKDNTLCSLNTDDNLALQNDDIDKAQRDYNREFIEHLFDSEIKLEKLENNDTREEVKPMLLSVNQNKLDENVETKQNRDYVIKKPTTLALAATKHQGTSTTTVLSTTQTQHQQQQQQQQQQPNNNVSSKTLPILAGNNRRTSKRIIMGSDDEPSDQQPLQPQSHQHQLYEMHERDTILRDRFSDNNDFDDDFQNNQMASSLTMMMTMMSGGGGSHPHYSFNSNSCDIVVLKDLSSSSDSLFTEPLTPPQSTTSVTAPLGSATAEPCSTTDDIDEDDEENDVDDSDIQINFDGEETVERHNKQIRNQTHIATRAFRTPTAATHLPSTLKDLTANTSTIKKRTPVVTTTTTTTAPVTSTAAVKENQRPLSDISITSGDTSGILSPTTAKAILELQKRHQSDKLSLLSISKTTYLELLPTGIESSPELETESPDEQMAFHLGKKLAQVLSGGNGNGSSNSSSNISATIGNSGAAAGNPGSPMQDSLTCCNVITGIEMFNIAKAKKIELPSLSSRLVATAASTPPIATSMEAQTIVATPTASYVNASTDAKHLPTVQSATLPAYSSTLASTNNATTSTATETQSTVIISFKSSQTPVQSQAPFTLAGACEHPQQQQQQLDNFTTPSYNDDTIAETMPYNNTSSFSLANSSHGSMTAQMGSPIFTPRTPKNNVLKKVASFTIEKSAGGSANGKVNNGDPSAGMLGQMENIGSKRSTFVPEKLSFAAYEKFEGQMLMKWLISSLQNNCNHLSEQDISMLTQQYCNNLIIVGVLKQISEKNDLETFKPFQMYQWTHTEAPTTSQPYTPGKLDKVTSWPYSSTPTPGMSRIPKAIQVDTPQHSEKESGFLIVLRKRLLSCASIAEVQIVVNDMLSGEDTLRRSSKRCMQVTDLLNASEATIYEYDKNITETASDCESGVQETGVQTEKVLHTINEFVCRNCKNNSNYMDRPEILRCDKEIQVFLNGECSENNLNILKPAIPAPPPIDGLIALVPRPPPPPMPLSIAPPPPPPPPPPSSATSFLPPPPPPPPSCLGESTAPPPHTSSSTPIAMTLNTSSVPPPPPPKAPSMTTPAPLPNAAEGGWFNQANTLRKTAVNPPKPMKPLYWTRIVTQPPPPKPPQPIAPTASTTGDTTDSSTPSTSPDEPPIHIESPSSSAPPKEIWQEIDETNLDNIDEFTELFSREAVIPKAVPKIKTQVRTRPIKVLDSKRSQNVGILLRSSHVDFCEIEHAIYHVDTSVVSLETLQQINKNKATNEELERIKEQGDTPLDEPEQFLLKISQISLFTERISCMVFMAEFEETATVIERKLEVVMQLSQFLMESEELKLIFAIILTLGNYMNGGNRQRGQADGFTLEILSKLKDVKSKDSQTTLLHFIVRTYIGRKRKEGVQLLEIPLPIPEPSDVERATQVDFEELKGQIAKLNDQLNAKKRITDKVIIHSTAENTEPFKSKMEEFIKNASIEIDKLFKELDECQDVFIEAMKFYHYAPKSGTLEQSTPNKFFEHWTNFTNDFKDIMKKEIAMLWNELLKKSKGAQTRKTVKTTKVKPGGLKERIMRLNKKL